MRRCGGKLHPAAEKIALAQQSKHQIAVGNGGLAPATAITDRARLRPGALRPDGDTPERVNRGNRAAAGADFDHFDDGYPQR